MTMSTINTTSCSTPVMIPTAMIPVVWPELKPSLLSLFFSVTCSVGFSVTSSVSTVQSGAWILSNVALQVGSNWNRDDPTLIEALPSCIQLCISVAKSEALMVGVPEILAR